MVWKRTSLFDAHLCVPHPQHTNMHPAILEQCFTWHIRKGSLGGVFPGIDNCIQQVVAINITDLEEAEDGTEDFWQEITILNAQLLSHPGIPRC
uniref:Uncharacterized protein n=1 Tax=Canis lupus dingo TaxID=286419 RepID=A0A8C0R3D3_CANLU